LTRFRVQVDASIIVYVEAANEQEAEGYAEERAGEWANGVNRIVADDEISLEAGLAMPEATLEMNNE
jgi:hypothetical protein